VKVKRQQWHTDGGRDGDGGGAVVVIQRRQAECTRQLAAGSGRCTMALPTSPCFRAWPYIETHAQAQRQRQQQQERKQTNRSAIGDYSGRGRRPQHYKYNSVWRWRWRWRWRWWHLVVQQRVDREAQARLGIRGTQLLLAAQNLVVMQAARVAQSVIVHTHTHTRTGKGESSTTNGREGDVEDVRWRAIGALTPLQGLGHTARAARLERLLYIGAGSRMMSTRACVNCLPCAQSGATYCATSSSTGATRGRSRWQLAVTHQHTTQVARRRKFQQR